MDTGLAEARRVVVYIEDDPTNVLVIERLLARRPNVDLVVAASGVEGVEAVRSRWPALVLLDLNLPDLNGEDVLARLRASPDTECIPVVVLSADATQGRIAALHAAGATDFLTKPLDLFRVLAVVDAHLGSDPVGSDGT